MYMFSITLIAAIPACFRANYCNELATIVAQNNILIYTNLTYLSEKLVFVFFLLSETWEKKNLRFHDNGTVTFNQEKIYVFNEEMSVGPEDDVVVVPNIPMLVFNLNKIFIWAQYESKIFRAPPRNPNMPLDSFGWPWLAFWIF